MKTKVFRKIAFATIFTMKSSKNFISFIYTIFKLLLLIVVETENICNHT